MAWPGTVIAVPGGRRGTGAPQQDQELRGHSAISGPPLRGHLAPPFPSPVPWPGPLQSRFPRRAGSSGSQHLFLCQELGTQPPDHACSAWVRGAHPSPAPGGPPHRGTPEPPRTGSWAWGLHTPDPAALRQQPRWLRYCPHNSRLIRQALGRGGGGGHTVPPPRSGNQRAHDFITAHYARAAGGHAGCAEATGMLFPHHSSLGFWHWRRHGGSRDMRQAAVTVINLPSARTTALGRGAACPCAGTAEERGRGGGCIPPPTAHPHSAPHSPATHPPVLQLLPRAPPSTLHPP